MTYTVPSNHVLRMARQELKVYGDTARYRDLIALANRTATAEYETFRTA